MRFPMIIVSFVAVLLVLSPVPAKAHPHAWIDVTVTVLLDDDGRVRGLHQTWLFDDFYSAFVMEGAMTIGGGKVSQEALDSLLAENMGNLAEYDYFTEVASGENQLEMAPPINATTQLVGNRLQMAFEVPLASAITANDIPFNYRIYDPTFYVEMVHAETDDNVTFSDASAPCTAVITEPNPDPEKFLFASSLDQSEQGYDGLGRYFAEVVTVTCD